MGKMLMIQADKCTGCHNCALACSMTHEQSFRLPAARLHVYTWEREGFSVPMMCQHCSDAPCIPVCTPHAIEWVDDVVATRARKRAFAAKFKMAFAE